MKITDLEIDGFGVWHDLKLTEPVAPRHRVLRPQRSRQDDGDAVHPQRAVRHVAGAAASGTCRRSTAAQPGGALGIAEGELRFRASRIADRGPDDVGRVICTTADGATGGDRLLRESLADVDEPTFTNVFAVGLDEVQELGTLSGTQGGRVDLPAHLRARPRQPVRRHPGARRQPRRAACRRRASRRRSSSLTAQRDRLRAEVDRLREQNRLWSQLAVKIKELDEQIAAVETRGAQGRARTPARSRSPSA